MSVGTLSGPVLEEGAEPKLEVLEKDGYGYHAVVRWNGTMQLVYGVP
jgi:hypothetical protein